MKTNSVTLHFKPTLFTDNLKMGKQSGIKNERELVSKLTEWLGENINRNKFSFKEATNESSTKIAFY